MQPRDLIRLRWGLIGTLTLLTGCAVPAYQPPPLPMFVPSAPGGTGGPQSAPTTAGAAREFTLDGAIRTALEADPQIRAGFEAVRQAEADLVTAGLLPNPELNTDLLMMPWGRSFRPNKQGGPTQTDLFVGFPIDWFLFGKRAAAIVAAQKGVDVATAQFAELVRQRISGTIAAFYDVLEAQAQLELAREDLANLMEVERITAKRVELGGVGTVELDRVRVSIYSSRREVRTRETLLAGALSRLRSFLGFADSVPLVVRGDLGVAKPAPPLSADQAFALAEQNRPDLIALKRQIALAAAGLELEQRRAYPEIKPAFGYTRQFQKEIAQPDADSWNVAMQMTLPMFDRNQGNIAKAQSLKTQAELNLNAQLVSLRAEVDQAVQAFQAARDALTIDDPGQLEAARTVRDKIRAAYELGGKSLFEVLDAQRAYRETYRLHIASRSGYWHSLHALNAAIGKQVLR
ncbi:TolC family protein [Candidatus Methylocalor cossyra]|uniref:Heavy metal RND efflux outer membrane protein, CzcC family n=1 Tax=Candidatus Methylocalor cossyra TaxID=3108543 RepID=A0ABP1C611_9GAMM